MLFAHCIPDTAELLSHFYATLSLSLYYVIHTVKLASPTFHAVPSSFFGNNMIYDSETENNQQVI